MRRPTDGESLNVEWGFLEPRGVVDGEDERAETDLAAQDQIAAGRHDEDGKCNLAGKSLRRLPHGGRQLSWERI